MPDALRTRLSKRLASAETNVSKEVVKKTESLISIGTSRNIGQNWSLGEETMLLTPDERADWVEYALLPGAKNRFKYLQGQHIKGRMDNSLIEV